MFDKNDKRLLSDINNRLRSACKANQKCVTSSNTPSPSLNSGNSISALGPSSRPEKSSMDENLLEIIINQPNVSLEDFEDSNEINQSISSRGKQKPTNKTPHNNKKGNNSISNTNRRPRAKTFNFRIVVNSGGGDCLFLTLSEFLGDRKTGGSGSYLNVLHDQIRKKIVNYIVKPDDAVQNNSSRKNNQNQNQNTRHRGNSNNYTIWNRYRQGIKISLEKHVRFFRSFNLNNTDERVEALAREEYQNYMSQAGVFGTYVELCAAMEIYSFSATLVEEATASNQPAYFVYHLDLSENENEISTKRKNGRKQTTTPPRAHILFTGSLDQGHFELLQPIRPKKPTTIPKGVYGVQEKNDKLRFIALVQLQASSEVSNRTSDENCGDRTGSNTGTSKCNFNSVAHKTSNNTFKNKSAITCKPNLKRNIRYATNPLGLRSGPDSSLPSPKRMKTRSSWRDDNVEDENDNDNQNDSGQPFDSYGSNSKDDDDDHDNNRISQILRQSCTATISNIIGSKLLFANELEKLANLYTITLSELKSSFEMRILDEATKEGTSAHDEWAGVRNSRVLSFGRFQTAFMHFQPYTFTPFCPTMGAVECIVYNGDSLLVTEMDQDEKEVDCGLKTGEFRLEIGSLYTLENNSDFPVLLRVVWID